MGKIIGIDLGTTNSCVSVLDGTKPKVPLMRQMEGFDYAEFPGVQILRLPYQMDEASMVIFLPRDAKGLAAIEQKFCDGTLGDWQKRLDESSVRVDVSFPRFRFASGFDLKGVLRSLGLECAFDPLRAEFGTIRAEEPIFLGAAYHKGFVAVDEKGTEAAAATKFGVAGEAMPTEPISFRADRPFFFLIQDGDTKAILFMGRFAQP